MRIILLGEEMKQSISLDVKHQWLLAGLALAVFLFITFISTIWVAVDRGARLEETHAALAQMQDELLLEQGQLNTFYTYADTVFSEHSRKAGELQARISRLEALGGRLADITDFSEFDFYSTPALGGPHESLQESDSTMVGARNVMEDFQQMTQVLKQREHQLQAIESLLDGQQLRKDSYLAGKPVESGWLSSPFGQRVDPFHGRLAWHKGVDYAGKQGTKVLSVASGVVVWSGKRYGYGQMVEVDHGNGYTTRYGHNKENLVEAGEVVQKGQAIAAMGSTGRSTGPHVHFEVLKLGKQVDPERYIYRKTL